LSPDPPFADPVEDRRLLLGNEAIAQGLYEEGCRVAAGYPGTPSTEILEALTAYRAPDLHLEWSVNEKVAMEVACAASYSGLRTAVVMKQVGLNVALDPLMSLAYTGVEGGMLVIVADDPGPHSSQTEQDTRLIALASGIPVLDPITPEEALEMIRTGFGISEKHGIPVIVRPLLRVCHSRAPIRAIGERVPGSQPRFEKDVNRWAATPKHRLTLHQHLIDKLKDIKGDDDLLETYRFLCGREGSSEIAIVASGVPAAYAYDYIQDRGLQNSVPLLAVGAQHPLNVDRITDLLGERKKILVLEEPGPFMEIMLAGDLLVDGRHSGSVPSAGEMTPDTVAGALEKALGLGGGEIRIEAGVGSDDQDAQPEVTTMPPVSETPPVLCAGCSHRSSFWALKKAIPGGIFTGDIGCYTLGRSLGAVDTVLCMGASVSQAAGFYWAFNQSDAKSPPIAAVIGDSTFYHSGIPGLINAVQHGAAFVLLILDNGTTAMTGGQPTPGSGKLADGGQGNIVPLEGVVRGCGVEELWVADPQESENFTDVLRLAADSCYQGRMAVVISRSPCVLDLRDRQGPVPEIDQELCDECRLCTDSFGCPALVLDAEGVRIIEDQCPGCGVCVTVCPRSAISVGDPVE
jgi:indolepyruvate ferredoxin oxidoreductase alpha subunit